MEYELLVESEIVAEILNGKYVPAEGLVPLDMSIFANKQVFIWMENAA